MNQNTPIDTNLIQYLNSSPFFVDLENEDKNSRTRFINEFQKLPQPLKDLLMSAKTSDFIFLLSRQYGLEEEKIRMLALIVRYVVVGNAYIKNMSELISRGLTINQEIATAVSNNIFNRLFAPVIEDIKKIQISKFGQAAPISPLQPVQKPQPLQPQKTGIENPNVINLRDKGE